MNELKLILMLFLIVPKLECKDFDVYWRDFRGNIPKDAVLAQQGVYVGQVIYEGFLIPGTIYSRSKKFVSEYYGKFEVDKNIKILCSGQLNKIKWKPIHIDNPPKNLQNIMIEGGFQNDFTWYIGKAFRENQWRVGKVNLTSPHFKGLNIWNNDGSYARVFDFEVLVYEE